MSELREGWYWVKIKGRPDWFAARYTTGFYSDSPDPKFILGYYDEDDVIPDVVGPRIPSPDEDWVCVPREPTEEMYEFMKAKDMTGYNRWRFALLAAPSPEDEE